MGASFDRLTPGIALEHARYPGGATLCPQPEVEAAMTESENPKTGEATEAKKEPPHWMAATGAAVGGVIGCIAFFVLLRHASIYALVLPGALIGLGRALGAKQVNVPLGIVCGLGALVAAIALDWRVTTAAENETIINHVLTLHQRPMKTTASIAAGTLLAVWFGVGRRGDH
jgi:hypothetical protein